MFYSKLTFRRRLGLRFNTSPRLSVTMAVLCVTYLLTPILSTPTVGQDKPAKRKPPAPPDPKRIALQTKDQVALTGTYFAGTKGENTVPIILIHGWEGVGGEFNPLAQFLQSLGHAVVVPDLRGHGESVQRRTYSLVGGATAYTLHVGFSHSPPVNHSFSEFPGCNARESSMGTLFGGKM